MHDPLSKQDREILVTILIGSCGILLIALVATGPFQVFGMCGVAIATVGVLLSSKG